MDNKQKLEQSVGNLIDCLLDATKQATETDNFDIGVEHITFANSIADALKKIVDLGIVIVSVPIDKTSTTETIPQEIKVVKEKKTTPKKEVV